MRESIPNRQIISDVWNAVKDRSLPLKSLTKEGYESLSEEEKQSEVVYLIPSDLPTSSTGSGGISREDVEEIVNEAVDKVKLTPISKDRLDSILAPITKKG